MKQSRDVQELVSAGWCRDDAVWSSRTAYTLNRSLRTISMFEFKILTMIHKHSVY